MDSLGGLRAPSRRPSLRHLSVALALTLTAGCASVVTEDRAPVSSSDDAPAEALAVPAVVPVAPAPAAVASPLAGSWYLDSGGVRLTLQVTQGAGGALAGAIAAEATGVATPVTVAAWDGASGRARLRYARDGGYEWLDARVADGVLAGRIAFARGDAEPAPEDYRRHVTGWNSTALDRAPVPRVFDVRWSDGRLGRVRVDRAAPGSDALVGTLKVHATAAAGARGEQEERDLAAVRWDGASLAFEVSEGGATWFYRGQVEGRTIRGEATTARLGGGRRVTWAGARAEVLSHGLTARTAEERARWGRRARRQLALLMMDGAPSPASSVVRARTTDGAPIASRRPPVAGAPPQAYTLSELDVEHAIADPRGGADLRRASHLLVAYPTTPAPARGHPVVLAFNGHYGSARQVMDPDGYYGYGDDYARRGYVVVAVDVSHRPAADRAALYGDIPAGDDPATGNVAHPAARAAGMDSDWEENGERAWDAMRALDYALTLPGVDRSRVLVTGLSMGGEVATLVGALDPRVSSVVAAGYAPDLSVVARHGNHRCWQWAHGDATEYVDTSDLHALIAPRLLVVETGTVDYTFSDFRAPFASDKQVLRRSRAAWADAPHRLVHFLHGGAHVYRVGDPALDASPTRGITLPLQVAPEAPGSLAWQTDARTVLAPMTVFDLTRGAFER